MRVVVPRPSHAVPRSLSTGSHRVPFRRDYGDLFRARPDNTFLIKLSYWFSP
ncbi:MAG TPA: hypothetical protein VFJ96_12365 [Gemmatimonadaceae bacterium]|nr:hypothetical protein [Gemmatimonadaceae bacterium]